MCKTIKTNQEIVTIASSVIESNTRKQMKVLLFLLQFKWKLKLLGNVVLNFKALIIFQSR